MITLSRQSDSVALVSCPSCFVQNFADQKMLGEIRAGKSYISCPKCQIMVNIVPFEGTTPTPLTIEDLDRISLGDVTARTASDDAFGEWARYHMPQKNDGDPWTLQQRIDFCDYLLLLGEITLLPEEELCRS